MGQGDEQLLRELHAGLEVLKSQQTEINRRLGLIEKSIDEDEEADEEKSAAWWTWFMQTITQVLLVSALVALGKTLGIEVVW